MSACSSGRSLEFAPTSGIHFCELPDLPFPADQADQTETVAGAAARNHPSTRAGGQDDVGSKETPSNYYSSDVLHVLSNPYPQKYRKMFDLAESFLVLYSLTISRSMYTV